MDVEALAAEPDRAAAEAMWEASAAARPEVVAACPDHTVEHFGDTVRLADELLDLVLSGEKRATSALVAEFAADGEQLPRVGSHWVVCDGRGTPRAILRSTELRLATYDTVDAEFAADEGEDDRTLESWRENHRRYWERTTAARGMTWSQDEEVVLERFRVVWPPDVAD